MFRTAALLLALSSSLFAACKQDAAPAASAETAEEAAPTGIRPPIRASGRNPRPSLADGNGEAPPTPRRMRGKDRGDGDGTAEGGGRGGDRRGDFANMTPEERTAKRQERMAEGFRRLDADGDGKILPTELEGDRRGSRLLDDFAAHDTDGDGSLSAAELEAAMKSQRGPGRHRRGGADEGDGDQAPAAVTPPAG